MSGETLGDLIATLGSIDNDEIDWGSIRQATVLIQQTFRYDYPSPITDLRQRLMVVPPERREAVAVDGEQPQHGRGDRERADRAEAEHHGGVGDRLDPPPERVVGRVRLAQHDGGEARLTTDARGDVLHARARVVAGVDHGLDRAVG